MPKPEKACPKYVHPCTHIGTTNPWFILLLGSARTLLRGDLIPTGCFWKCTRRNKKCSGYPRLNVDTERFRRENIRETCIPSAALVTQQAPNNPPTFPLLKSQASASCFDRRHLYFAPPCSTKIASKTQNVFGDQRLHIAGNASPTQSTSRKTPTHRPPRADKGKIHSSLKNKGRKKTKQMRGMSPVNSSGSSFGFSKCKQHQHR